MFNIPFLRTEVQKIGAHVRELRNAHEQALRRREDLRTLPVPKSDLVALLEAWIDAEVEKYPAALATNLAFLARNPQDIGGPSLPHVDLLAASGHVGITGSPMHIQRNLFFFFAPQFKDGIRRAIEAMPAYEAGPPMAEREKELARLDVEIPKLEQQLSEIVAEAQQAGIALDGAAADFSKRARSK